MLILYYVWEQERLGKISNFSTGKGITISQSLSKGFPIVSGGIDVMGYYSKYNRMENTITIARAGKCGYVSFISEKFYLNDKCFSLDLKENINSYFLFNLLKKNEKRIMELGSNSSIPTITSTSLKAVDIFRTSYDEQKAIAILFVSINSLITLHQRELKILKNFKKSLFQKIIAGKNLTILPAKLTKMTNVWEQEKLINIGKTYSGLTGKTKKDFGYGDAKYVTYLNVFNNPISNIVQLDFIKKDTKQNSVKYGDIFVTISSETPEEIGMTSIWQFNEKNVYLNSFCFGFRLDQIDNYNLYFLANNLRHKRLRRNIVLLAQGISRFNISKQKFMNLNIYLPSIIEQSRIGDICQSSNSLITLHQRGQFRRENEKKIRNFVL
ncbi:restriction endonuclease subunit S [Mycoplasmopsis cynos]|uniref:restriction endonuclease subunit S n=1 Tax=Mycoplasmopsis cynos TaxID=171284 RepID=UPI002AFE22FF|nr:restriction endonuclease subunit S [Mycoplasmopsis cynos]WQQ16023.1 restriction endonuclease subunit S [Mycoplasmopsis cynos]